MRPPWHDSKQVLDVILFGWCATTAAACSAALRASGARLAGRVTAPETAERLDVRSADLLLVAGWPERLPAELLAGPRLGAVNVHPSLLPRYRAREPVFWTILSGDDETGVTLHRMTDRLDAGPVLLQRAIAVPPRSTSATLAAKLDALAGELTGELCRLALRGSLPEGEPQRGAVTTFRRVRASDGDLSWTESAPALERRVRACTGILEARVFYQGMKVVVLEAEVAPTREPAPPGTVLAVEEGSLVIAAGDETALALQRCAFLGRTCSGAAIANQLRLEPRARLESAPSGP